jgi:hypothetical protein
MRLLPVTAALCALGAAAPRGAAAATYSGSLGGYYLQDRYDDPTTAPYRFTSFQLDANLRLNGTVFRRGLLDYTAGVAYNRLHLSRVESTDIADGFTWDVGAGILQTPQSPVHLTLNTSRATSNGWNKADRAGSLGTTLTTSYSGTLAYTMPGRPVIGISGAMSQSDTTVAGIDVGTTTGKTVSANVGNNQGALSYTFDYAGAWLDGPSVYQKYVDHRAGAHGSLRLGVDTYAAVDEAYYLREPTAGAPQSLRFETSRFLAYVRTGTPETTQHNVDYSYGRAFSGAELASNADQISQNLSYNTTRAISKEVTVSGGATLSLADVRSGTTAERGTGESVSGAVDWSRPLSPDTGLTLRGGGSVGLLQVSDRPVEGGYGLNGSARLSRRWEGGVGGYASYTASYGSNIRGVAGWAFAQTAEVRASWDPAPNRNGTALLTYTVARQYGRVFGDGASRILSLETAARWSIETLVLRLGLASGIADPTKRSFSADGVILQPPYDVENRFISVQSDTAVARNLVLTAFAGYTFNDTVGQPNGKDVLLTGMISYNIGAFRLSLEDRYNWTDLGGLTRTENRIMVLAARSFGGRF